MKRQEELKLASLENASVPIPLNFAFPPPPRKVLLPPPGIRQPLPPKAFKKHRLSMKKSKNLAFRKSAAPYSHPQKHVLGETKI